MASTIHTRKTVTPKGGQRELVVDCSCGRPYIVPQPVYRARLREALDAEHARHIEQAAKEA